MNEKGSSPLARGLHVDSQQRPAPARIIPARAGFTCRPGRRPGRRTDHPRSRGVYRPLPPGRHRRSGSSPLARGLLFMVRIPFLRGGIIPARAGFTGYPQKSSVPGVGSSPLARGLRPTPQRHRPRRRIIPARAGFTTSPTTTPPGKEDHPRSRGVYGYSPGRDIYHFGSSPLARGLH